MPRPQKNNADWFSHDKDMRNDRKIKALRSKYGMNGYATYSMLLEALTDAEYCRIEYSDIEIELLAGDFGIDSELFKEILQYMDKLNLITIGEYIFCEKLDERLKPVFEERERQRKKYKNTVSPKGKGNKKEFHR